MNPLLPPPIEHLIDKKTIPKLTKPCTTALFSVSIENLIFNTHKTNEAANAHKKLFQWADAKITDTISVPPQFPSLGISPSNMKCRTTFSSKRGAVKQVVISPNTNSNRENSTADSPQYDGKFIMSHIKKMTMEEAKIKTTLLTDHGKTTFSRPNNKNIIIYNENSEIAFPPTTPIL
nr:hypothetical protein [Pseudomonas sp. Hp2]